ncbi:MAG: hypothetical protein LBB19_01725 [Puniceicoccales bacterium]|jgi:hypothetical protein|nr:hypothetical protein [Puniceicoccales bacterium]
MSTPDMSSLQNYSNGTYNVSFNAKDDAKDGSYTITKTGDSYTISKDGIAQITSGSFNDVKALFADGTIESISMPRTPVISPSSKMITDDDIRGLMKLLLQAFTLMINAQRQGDLNDLNGVLNALATKVAAMEESKEAAYKAAKMQAVGQIVSGSIGIVAGTVQVGCAGVSGSKLKSDPHFATAPGTTDISQATSSQTSNLNSFGQSAGTIGQGSGQLVQGAMGLTAAGYSAEQQEAEIKKEEANAQLEFWKQGESMDEKSMEAFFNFLKTILSILQEYRQNAASTEGAIARMS